MLDWIKGGRRRQKNELTAAMNNEAGNEWLLKAEKIERINSGMSDRIKPRWMTPFGSIVVNWANPSNSIRFHQLINSNPIEDIQLICLI